MLLLGGKKCLSCDRAFDGEAPQTANSIELEKERAHASIMRQVERSLIEGEDVDMQFVAVKVGSGSQYRGDDGCLYDSREVAAEPSLDDISFCSTRGNTAGRTQWPRAPQSPHGNASPRFAGGAFISARKVVASSGMRAPSPALIQELARGPGEGREGGQRPGSRLRQNQGSPMPVKAKRMSATNTLSAALRSSSTASPW